MMQNWAEPDLQREAPRRLWDPSRRLLRAIRAYQNAGPGWMNYFRRKGAVLRHRFWSTVCQAEIDLTTKIGGGLLLPHPNGIVIHPQTEIGPNCLLFQQVTLGTVAGRQGAPKLGIHVDVGAGARILGPVQIGDHAVIGANAVVLTDVPAHATAVGIPARIIEGKNRS
jgi:serine O-acetyltransferase